MSFIITKKHAFEIENEVYFATTLKEAEARKAELELSGERQWLIAVVVDG